MKVAHVTISVADMDASVKFYRDVMGLEKSNQFNPRPGLTITFMKGEEGGIIELIEDSQNPQETGLTAVGIEVEDIHDFPAGTGI